MYNPYSLEGKTILVTGASSGIGRATAIECSKLGARLIILGRNGERLAATLHSLEGEGHAMHLLDLTDTERMEELVDGLPEIDGCVCNAGIISRVPVAFIKKDALQDILNVNTIAPVMMVHRLVKKKKVKKGGSIVFTASIPGIYSVAAGNSLYSLSKGAIDCFMRNAAVELAAKRIRVNSVNPGMVETPMTDGDDSTSDEDVANDIARYPLKRYGRPEEIAWGIVYLLSDAAAWVTGTRLKIDGGYTL